ncbi:MAG: ribonuclease III [Chloroflexi bacterium]|nr:ribonuclease III [Chloroflexota bacterium]
MEEVLALEQLLRVDISDYSLLATALTHRSYLNEHPEITEDNERLEFLGDAVVDLVVANYLFRRFPDMAEGEMTALRAALVREDGLAGFARLWQLDKFLRLGLGEVANGGRERTTTLCATFEAVIGALYVDVGLTAVQPLLEGLVEPALQAILRDSSHKDARSEFQAWAQATFNTTPRYKVIATTGPEHARQFTMQVMVGEQVWGEGEGKSKQLAAQSAAAHALQKIVNGEL